jgi:hypothetical protein
VFATFGAPSFRCSGSRREDHGRPPFFNQVNAPLAIMLLFLMGVGPIVACAAPPLGSPWPFRDAGRSGVAGLAAVARDSSPARSSSLRCRRSYPNDLQISPRRALMTMTERAIARCAISSRRTGVMAATRSIWASSSHRRHDVVVYRVEEIHTVKPGESFTWRLPSVSRRHRSLR